MKYKAHFCIEVALDGCDGIEMECRGTLPFVPHPKMMIAPIEGDDLREVDRVYWMTDKPGQLTVWFKFESDNLPDVMRKIGWREMA